MKARDLMKKALAILLCAAMAMSFVACGTEKDNVQVQNSTNEIENSNIDASDSVAPITEDKSESDLIIGSWYDEENDCTFEFVDDKHVKLYLVGGTLDAEYLLSDGMMTISAGDENDKFDVVLEDSKLELMHQGDDFKYSFVRCESTVNNDSLSTSEKVFEICVVDDNTADIAVFNADDNSNWSIHFDDSFTLYYGDLGQGYECNLFRENDVVDTFNIVNAQNAKIIHLKTSYIDFNSIKEYGYTDETQNVYHSYAPSEVMVNKISVSEDVVEISNPETEDEKVNDTNTDTLPFVGVKYYNDGPTWGASELVLKGADANGLPTKIVISNSGDSASGLELNGTFSIKITEYIESDNTLIGRFVGVDHDTVKGEFVSGNGDRLIIQID